jgi:sugar O-acyltransferase (sialic acid O-acetyltransferase NeuD family)
MPRVALLGGGGHARDLLGGIAGTPGMTADGFFDDRPSTQGMDIFRTWGLPYLGLIDGFEQLDRDTEYLIAIGYPDTRRAVWQRVKHLPNRAATLVHPDSDVGYGTRLGRGVVVLSGARVSPAAKLGEHVHVSYLSAVGHDSTVGDFSTIMPAAIVSGDAHVGDGVLIGTNATVLEGLSVGDGARIGAGAVVVRDVEAGTTVVGVPARALSSN